MPGGDGDRALLAECGLCIVRSSCSTAIVPSARPVQGGGDWSIPRSSDRRACWGRTRLEWTPQVAAAGSWIWDEDCESRHGQFEPGVRCGTEGRAPIIHISVLVTSSTGSIEARGRGRRRLDRTRVRLSDDEASFRTPVRRVWLPWARMGRWTERISNLGGRLPRLMHRMCTSSTFTQTSRSWGGRVTGDREATRRRPCRCTGRRPCASRASFPLRPSALLSLLCCSVGQATFLSRHKGK